MGGHDFPCLAWTQTGKHMVGCRMRGSLVPILAGTMAVSNPLSGGGNTANAETAAAAQDISTKGDDGRVSGEGRIERGVVCPQVRLDDGRVFSLQGSPVPQWQLKPGTRVRLMGKPVGGGGSPCRGTTLQLESLELDPA